MAITLNKAAQEQINLFIKSGQNFDDKTAKKELIQEIFNQVKTIKLFIKEEIARQLNQRKNEMFQRVHRLFQNRNIYSPIPLTPKQLIEDFQRMLPFHPEWGGFKKNELALLIHVEKTPNLFDKEALRKALYENYGVR